MSLEKTAHLDDVASLREQLQSLQTRLSTLQGWRMKEMTDEQVDSVAEEVRDAMRTSQRHTATALCMVSRNVVQVLFVMNLDGENRQQQQWLTACISASCARHPPLALAWCNPSACSHLSLFSLIVTLALQVPCGHAQFCVKCCLQLQNCPLCRVPGVLIVQLSSFRLTRGA